MASLHQHRSRHPLSLESWRPACGRQAAPEGQVLPTPDLIRQQLVVENEVVVGGRLVVENEVVVVGRLVDEMVVGWQVLGWQVVVMVEL